MSEENLTKCNCDPGVLCKYKYCYNIAPIGQDWCDRHLTQKIENIIMRLCLLLLKRRCQALKLDL